MSHEDEYEYDDYEPLATEFKPRNILAQPGEPFDLDTLVKESESRIAKTVESGANPLLSVEDIAKLEEIRYLHDTALARSLKRDGHSKSSEGSLTIELGTYWARADGDNPKPGVSLYSYVLGPSRMHHFGTIDRALETVRGWYATEMSQPEEYDEEDLEEFDSALFDALQGSITVINLNTPEENTK